MIASTVKEFEDILFNPKLNVVEIVRELVFKHTTILEVDGRCAIRRVITGNGTQYLKHEDHPVWQK